MTTTSTLAIRGASLLGRQRLGLLARVDHGERGRGAQQEFCKLWKRHEVASTGVGRKELNHPTAGRMIFEHAVFNPAEAPEQRLVLYTPLPEEDTPAKLAALLGD